MLRASRAIILDGCAAQLRSLLDRPPGHPMRMQSCEDRVLRTYLRAVLLRQAVGYGIDYGWMMTQPAGTGAPTGREP